MAGRRLCRCRRSGLGWSCGARPTYARNVNLGLTIFLKERVHVTSQTCLPTSTWFLVDEGGRPVGQIRRPELPEAGMNFEAEGRFEEAQVVEVIELRPTCSMRRFRVIMRIVR